MKGVTIAVPLDQTQHGGGLVRCVRIVVRAKEPQALRAVLVHELAERLSLVRLPVTQRPSLTPGRLGDG